VTHEHDHAAAFAGPESRRASVVDAHRIASECASLSKPYEFEWIGAQINPARDGYVQITDSE
jgi:hypothetical protein